MESRSHHHHQGHRVSLRQELGVPTALFHVLSILLNEMQTKSMLISHYILNGLQCNQLSRWLMCDYLWLSRLAVKVPRFLSEADFALLDPTHTVSLPSPTVIRSGL